MSDVTAPGGKTGLLEFKPKPSMPPPVKTTGVVAWLRANLFGSWLDSFMTILGLYVLYVILSGVYHWGVETAVWQAETRRVCLDTSPYGARWAVFSLVRTVHLRPLPARKFGASISAGPYSRLGWPRYGSRGDLQSVHWLCRQCLSTRSWPAIYTCGERGWFMEVMVAVAIVSFIACWAHVLLCLGFSRNLGDILIRLSGFQQSTRSAAQISGDRQRLTGCYCGHGSDPGMGTTLHEHQ